MLSLISQQFVRYPDIIQSERRKLLAHRASEEETQLAPVATRNTKPEEEVGRTSGDAAWRQQRGELGANEAAKQK
ncbi:unnamed protein product, partial [Durusdinium trenchii]